MVINSRKNNNKVRRRKMNANRWIMTMSSEGGANYYTYILTREEEEKNPVPAITHSSNLISIHFGTNVCCDHHLCPATKQMHVNQSYLTKSINYDHWRWMQNKKSNNSPTQPVPNSMCVVFFFNASSDSQLYPFFIATIIDLVHAYWLLMLESDGVVCVVVGACLT